MKTRTTLLLLAAALLIGIGVVLIDLNAPPRRGSKAGFLVQFNRQKVDRISIRNREAAIELEKSDSNWRMIKPLEDRADSDAVNQLLTSAEYLRAEDRLDDLGKGNKRKQFLKDLGLVKPRLRLKLHGHGMPDELLFGKDTAVDGRTYLRIQEQDPIFVISDELKRLVEVGPDFFRDHRLTPFLTTEVDRVILRVSGGEIELAKAQDNWELVRPIKARASNEIVTNLLHQINGTRIERFSRNESSTLGGNGLDPARRSVTFCANDQKIEIVIGGPSPDNPDQIDVQIPGRVSVFGVDKALSASLNVSPNSLRDRKIARLNQDLIDRITIQSALDPAFTLARRETQWFFVERGVPANDAVVRDLVETLNSEEIREYVSDVGTDLAKYGLDRPQLRITFSSFTSENTAESDAGETPISTVIFGRTENGVVYAKLEEEPYIFLVSEDLLQQLPATAYKFRSREIYDLTRNQLERVSIEYANGSRAELERNQDGQWIVRDAPNGQDEIALQSFLNALVGLRAVHWLGTPRPALGIDQPALRIRIVAQIRDRRRQEEVLIGSATPTGAHYAQIASDNSVFLLSAQDFKTLSAPLKRKVSGEQ
jgi:hypothetical protein